MKESEVVVCILENKGKILLVKRSSLVKDYKGKWAGICGYVERDPYKTALKELYEEVSLSEEDLELIKEGKLMKIPDEDLKIRWKVYPFLFECKSPDKIRLDWENVEYKWIDPEEVSKFDTIPALKKVLEMLYDNSS